MEANMALSLRSLIPSSGNGGGTQASPHVFGSLHREIDRLFDDFTRGGLNPLGQAGQVKLVPSIDVTEDDQVIEATVELPGLERDDVEISIDDDFLTVRGEKKVERTDEDQKKRIHVTERAYGVFYRALQLPPGVDPSAIRASMANGVLKITIPKPKKSQPKRVEVQEGTGKQAQASTGKPAQGASAGAQAKSGQQPAQKAQN